MARHLHPSRHAIDLRDCLRQPGSGEFEDPTRFDVRRRAKGALTFGFGQHFCLGAQLARAELETALRVILTRLPDLRLVEKDSVRITGTFHHLLRGPNRLPVRFA